MRIVYLATVWDPSDIRDKLGISYSIVSNLQNLGHTVEVIDLSHKHKKLTRIFKTIGKFIPGNPYLWPYYSKAVTKLYNLELKKYSDFDAVFAFGSLIFTYLETHLKKICWIDATFPVLDGFHPNVLNWPLLFKRWGSYLDRTGLMKCDLLLVSSDWAANSVINDYKIPDKNIHVIPFGGNLPEIPSLTQIHKALDEKITDKTIRLLFIGLKWKAKGGERLIKVVRNIKKLGYSVEAHVVGLEPEIPEDVREEFKIHGFLSKGQSEKWMKLMDIFNCAHFFFMPSLGETYGHVYCEANAFGLPAIAYRIAGAAEIIKDGINGWAFPIETNMDEISNYIVKTFSSKADYRQIALSSRSEYDQRLSWQASFAKIDELLSSL